MDRAVIEDRIKKVYNCVQRLERYRKLSLEQYIENRDAQDIVERNFQVAIQACMDMANYIVARKRLPVPENEGNVFTILGEHGVISRELATRIRGMVGFRNVLVHDYLKIDAPTVHYLLTHNLEHFYAYCNAIMDFLETEEGEG